MKPAKMFQDLVVWKKSHQLVLKLYRQTESFPSSELYGLTQQLKRAAVSVPANIAEGFRKRSRADKARYMNIAQGSLEETRYYLILAQDLGYSNSAEVLDDVDEVGRLLDAYSRALLTPVS